MFLCLRPDEDVVEGDAAGDDDEGHGDAEPFVWQGERQDQDQQEKCQKEDRNNEGKTER